MRAVAVHPEAAVVASVGLDRYLRLHSTHTRQLLAKVYCKTLPTRARALQRRRWRRRWWWWWFLRLGH